MERERNRDREEGRERDRDGGRVRDRDRERDRGRYDQRRGETTRIGAGESYKPFGSRPRSPPRIDNFRSSRERSPRRGRPRSPVTDTWYGKNARDPSPRRRSRTPIRRIRTPPKDNWRTRSPRRRTPPRRFSPRRDEHSRARSPPRRDERRKSRSPFDRDRVAHRVRSPIRRISPPSGPRGFRPRSRSPDRRDIPKGPSANRRRRSVTPPSRLDRSALNSRNNSRRSSPRSYPDRMHISQAPSRQRSPHPQVSPGPPHKDRDTPSFTSRDRSVTRSTVPKSPPRGPTGLRVPTGPGANRHSSGPPQSSGHTGTSAPRPRSENSGPVAPPAGPRGYIPRGGSSARGGRNSQGSDRLSKQDTSSWGAAPPSRIQPTSESVRSSSDSHQRGSVSTNQTPSSSLASNSYLSSAPSGPAGGIPTGPRAGISSRPSPKQQHSSSSYSRSVPSAPAGNGSRSHPALANMPAIVNGGRIDPTASGIPSDVASRLKRKEEEEEILRTDLHAKEDRLKQSLKHWDKLSRESSAMGLRTELSERHVRTLAGEGGGGAF